MKNYPNLILLLSIVLFYSCKDCDDSITCPPFSEDAKQYLVYDIGDVITFVNDEGSEISFTIDNKTYSESNVIECRKSKGLCQCPEIFLDCNPYGSYNGTTDNGKRIISDTINNRDYEYDYLQYRVRTRLNNDGGIQNVYFQLLDIRGGFDFLPEIVLNENQYLLEEFSTANKTYQNVVKQSENIESNDGSDPELYTKFISEIYIQTEIGIIAFFDLQSNSMFYLKH
jgi:hypothetical protein